MASEDSEMQSAGKEPAQELSLDELEDALQDPNHPRHAEAQRVMDETVRPAMKRISSLLMPKLDTGGFQSLRLPPLGRDPLRIEPPRSGLADSIATSQERVNALLEAQREALAEKEAALAAEKARDVAEREADRVEARQQHRVMLGWTIASACLALAAVVVAVIALFVSGGS